VPTLVTILNGKIGLQQNKSIGKLTIIGVIIALLFTPISTISALLAIPGRFSVVDGDRSYFVFVVGFAFGISLYLVTFGEIILPLLKVYILTRVRILVRVYNWWSR
jgi:ABC-type enterochelin transport system permease subunit